MHKRLLTHDQEASRAESSVRELRGALVKFGNGAVVTKVSFPSDFSAVRISHLSQGTSARSVVDLLVSLGFDVSEDCVRVAALADDTGCSADVRVEDSQFAKRLCDMPAMKRRDGPRATPVNVAMPQTTNYRRVDSKKVHCSWHKPTKTVWLNFGNGDIAARVGSKFSAGTYTVLNRRVQCETPTRGAGHRNRSAWTITLSDVPIFAKEKDVLKTIPLGLIPRHVELSAASYNVDLEMANASIESLLLQAGPMERWEGASERSGKRFKASALFLNDEDARQAVKSFHDKPLPFNRNGKLTVQLAHTARLKIPIRVYEAVKQEIAGYEQVWESQRLQYSPYPPAQGLRVLKIEGESSEVVASAKAVLEKIIDGDVLMKDGKAVWAPSFAANGRACQRLKQLERECGVLIIRDKRRSQLRLLGPRLRYEAAQAAVLELAEASSSSTFIIPLDAQQFARAFKGGYRAVAAAIGEDRVILDITSHPRRILVVGSEVDFKTAQGILYGSAEASGAKLGTNSISDCAICWTEAENPVHTPCKHVYCAGCFEDLCFAGASSGPFIRCHGDAGGCGEAVPLTALQVHLSSAALEDVLDTAFTAHTDRRPNELRYCPTPDCGQMYRTADSPRHKDGRAGESRLFTCTVCLVAVCTACNVSHDGLTCDEQRDLAAGGHKALQAVKEKLKIKDCPECGSMIEKTFGCNHMTCLACKAHICWVCMKTFPRGDIVYDHMQREHGGIGVDYFPGL